MTQTTTDTEAVAHTIEVPGAVLTYDIRENKASTEPPLMLIGTPMAASGFTTLAGYFTDRTVVTYDPRGTERSKKTDDTVTSTPDMHADDVHRVIAALTLGPVNMFASSGGAVNSLALVARYPGDVRTLVAHEPPLASVVPDREAALAATEAIHEAYQSGGFGRGMAKFIAVTSHKGLLTREIADQPAPDPLMFGMPAEDDGSRDDPLLGQNAIGVTHYELDFDALRRAKTRIVLAAGEASGDQLAGRAAFAVAERLGTKPVIFPGGHGGFNRSEWDPTSDPEAFAAKLRAVLGS